VSDPNPRQPTCTPWPGGHRRGISASVAPHRCAGDWERPSLGHRWEISAVAVVAVAVVVGGAVVGGSAAAVVVAAAGGAASGPVGGGGRAGRRRPGTACDDMAGSPGHDCC